MRIIIQRVANAKVEVDGELVSQIGKGLFVLVGITTGDTVADAEYLYVSSNISRIVSHVIPWHLTMMTLYQVQKDPWNATLGRC
jgi:D-Tyr-tRNAtyr deacylase